MPQEKDYNVAESEKYLHGEDMGDHDIQTKENEKMKKNLLELMKQMN